jgi:hypothetical protein
MRRRWTVLGETQTELQQLARDPRIAPARILAREPEYELAYPTIGHRPARFTSRLRPLPTYELAVPTQQRLRRYDEPVATRMGEQASEGGEERPIGRPQRRSARLSAKHGQLVPQHEQLDVFGELAPPTPNEQPQHGEFPWL